jgi:hypothetical protein
MTDEGKRNRNQETDKATRVCDFDCQGLLYDEKCKLGTKGVLIAALFGISDREA